MSLFGYMGGKKKIAPQILKHMADHSIYVEPFFGSGAVFFKKGFKLGCNDYDYREVIGDLDFNVVNFFEQLQENPEQLAEYCSMLEYSEVRHQKSKTSSQYYKEKDNLKKAGLFFFNILSSFGSKLNSGFAYGRCGQNHVRTYKNKIKQIMEYSERLTDCFIFNKPYDVLIDRFDSEDTLFYFDPPYKDTGKYIIQKTNSFDYDKFAENIKKIKGKWILSHYKNNFILDNFEGYKIIELKHIVTMSKATINESREKIDNTECIVLNYDPAEVILWGNKNKENSLFAGLTLC